MPRRVRFNLVFAPEVVEHLAAIERRHHSLIKRAIGERLGHTPGSPTRNRKTLQEPADFGATWELCCGPRNRFRVFYEVDETEGTVWILAIGTKEGNRLLIGRGETQL